MRKYLVLFASLLAFMAYTGVASASCTAVVNPGAHINDSGAGGYHVDVNANYVGFQCTTGTANANYSLHIKGQQQQSNGTWVSIGDEETMFNWKSNLPGATWKAFSLDPLAQAFWGNTITNGRAKWNIGFICNLGSGWSSLSRIGIIVVNNDTGAQSATTSDTATCELH